MTVITVVLSPGGPRDSSNPALSASLPCSPSTGGCARLRASSRSAWAGQCCQGWDLWQELMELGITKVHSPGFWKRELVQVPAPETRSHLS